METYQNMTCGEVRITAAKLRINPNRNPNPRSGKDQEVDPELGIRDLAGLAVHQLQVPIPLALGAEAGEAAIRDPAQGSIEEDILGPPAAQGQGLAHEEEEEGSGQDQATLAAAVVLGPSREDPMEGGIGQGTGGIN